MLRRWDESGGRRAGGPRVVALRRASAGPLPTLRPRAARPRGFGAPPLRIRLGERLGAQRRPAPGSQLQFKDIARRVRARCSRPPEPEASLDVQPLRSGGIPGPIAEYARDWESELHDDLRRSFVSRRRKAFGPATLRRWWNVLESKIKWERPLVGERRLPRSAAWLTSGGCKCAYHYGGTSWPAQSMDSWFAELTDSVCRACGIREPPNSCNANFYEDGSQSVGWHSDDEPLFDATRRDALIVSLSLGATRTFELRPNDAVGEVTKLRLEDGDLCTMEGFMQKHYRHRVPVEKRVDSARINLTWRWIVRHEAGCPGRTSAISPAPGPVVVDLVEEDEEWAGRRAGGTSSEVTPEELEKRRKRALRFGGAPPAEAAKPAEAKPAEEGKPAEGKEAPPAPSAPAAAPSAPATASGGGAAGAEEAPDSAERRRLRAERFGMPQREKTAGAAAAGAAGAPSASSRDGAAAEPPAVAAAAAAAEPTAPPASSAPAAASTSGTANADTLDSAERRRRRAERFGVPLREKTASPAGPGPFAAAAAAAAAAAETGAKPAAASALATLGAVGAVLAAAAGAAAAGAAGGRWGGRTVLSSGPAWTSTPAAAAPGPGGSRTPGNAPQHPAQSSEDEERRLKRKARFEAEQAADRVKAPVGSSAAAGGAARQGEDEASGGKRPRVGEPAGPSGAEATTEAERRKLRAKRFGL